MRFALIATAIAAIAAGPFVVAAVGPHMDGQEFLSAVRCAAYEKVVGPGQGFAEERYRLNAEARRQPAETTEQARAEIGEITRQAAGIEKPADAAMLRQALAQACASQSDQDVA